MTTLIQVPGIGIAVAGPTRYYLPPGLEAREPSDPDRQLAALMCLYAHRLETARRGDEYTDEAAATFARLVLDMAAEELGVSTSITLDI